MTPEEIKKTWAEASGMIPPPNHNDFVEIYRLKKATALESLTRRYRRFFTLGAIMTVVSLFWMLNPSDLLRPDMKYSMSIAYMIYFATCASIDFWLYRGVSSIDCYRMSVTQVIDKAIYYRKKHLQAVAFLIPFALLILGMTVYSFYSDRYVIYGIATGSLTGLILGIRQLRQFMQEYREISKDC